MARNLEVGSLIGTYADGADLYTVMRTELKNTLATVGVTGTGNPVIHIIGLNGSCSSGFSLAVNDFSKITALQIASDVFQIDVSINSDNISIPIYKTTLITDTPSASANLRLNYFYEPVTN